MEEELSEVLRLTTTNLEYLNERIDQLNSHQFNYDLVGIALTILGVVFAVLAVIFFLNMKEIAKQEARNAANSAVSEYLNKPENINSVINSWLDTNLPEIAERAQFRGRALQEVDRGGEIGNAWDNLPPFTPDNNETPT